MALRNEAWAFILLHELGHVILRHPGNLAVEARRSRVNEQQADRFALDVLQRPQTIPMGMVLWVQATAPWFPNRADYQDTDEFETAVATTLQYRLPYA